MFKEMKGVDGARKLALYPKKRGKSVDGGVDNTQTFLTIAILYLRFVLAFLSFVCFFFFFRFHFPFLKISSLQFNQVQGLFRLKRYFTLLYVNKMHQIGIRA